MSPAQRQVRFYVAHDKSPKHEKFDILSGAMARCIRTAFGLASDDDRVFPRKQQGVINVDWVPVCSLEVPSEKDIVFLWNAPEMERLGLNKEELAKAFGAGARGPKVQWSS